MMLAALAQAPEGDAFPPALSPEASLAAMHARPGFTVELMACEPAVLDPIAIAWGADGRLWVVEMGDYPSGVDGEGKPGGQVRWLADHDGDGRYERATVFLDGLNFPTTVAPWRDGVLVIAAPDLIYAADTDGDGRADTREVLFTGFGEGNQQHRANGLVWGMDGWLYGANGDSNGVIKSSKTGKEVDISGRDFRIDPDAGVIDPQAGRTQFGRCRDDWGNWFGCSNSNPLFQFVLEDQYLRRNPWVAAPDGKVNVSITPGASPVFPRSKTLTRFNDFDRANRFTSACGAHIYRGDLFGPDFYGNSFVCEPVHNLVHREVLRREGLSFKSERAADELESEFLASEDNWFRPTQCVEGPDGALWIVDMYRQTIEHPKWIPEEWQKKLDLRAGADKGRLYRVYPTNAPPRPTVKLDQLSTADLVGTLLSASPWQRDTAQQLLVWRNDKSAVSLLKDLAQLADRPVSRAQALWTRYLLRSNDEPFLITIYGDEHPGVRREAVRVAQQSPLAMRNSEAWMVLLARDADPQVRLQVAYSLGELFEPETGELIARLALEEQANPLYLAALMSSLTDDVLDGFWNGLLRATASPPSNVVDPLVATASMMAKPETIFELVDTLAARNNGNYQAWELSALATLIETWAHGGSPPGELFKRFDKIGEVIADARRLAAEKSTDEAVRVQAVRLMGRMKSHRDAELRTLPTLLAPQTPSGVQMAAVLALGRMRDDRAGVILLEAWPGLGPGVRRTVLDVLLSREASVALLLTAVDEKRVAARDIDATYRERLLKSKNEKIRERATHVFAGAIDENRAKVVAQFQGVSNLAGDVSLGKAMFEKRCAVCHQLGGVGHAVGPDLAALSDNSPASLLVAVLDPNRAIEAKFHTYLAITDDGLSYTGILTNETGNSITLLGQEAKQQVVLRANLETLTSTGKSLMPEGLEKELTEQDLANVFAFVRAAKKK